MMERRDIPPVLFQVFFAFIASFAATLISIPLAADTAFAQGSIITGNFIVSGDADSRDIMLNDSSDNLSSSDSANPGMAPLTGSAAMGDDGGMENDGGQDSHGQGIIGKVFDSIVSLFRRLF